MDREDIENTNKSGDSMPEKKKPKDKVLGKRKRPQISLEYEEEHEVERAPQKRMTLTR